MRPTCKVLNAQNPLLDAINACQNMQKSVLDLHEMPCCL